MPLILLLVIAYLVWRFWKKSNHNESERLRILEARVRLLEAQLDQALHGSPATLVMDTQAQPKHRILDMSYSDVMRR